MKLMTRHTDYAVRALLVLERNGDRYLSTRKIAEQEGIPYQFLRRILGELIKNDLVESREGTGGGFRLTADPVEIRIVDLIRIFQGDFSILECLVGGNPCPNRDTCVIRQEIIRIEKIVKDELGGITIASLSKSSNSGRRRTRPSKVQSKKE